MSFLNKLGIGVAASAGSTREVPHTMGSSGRPRANGAAPVAAVGAARAPELRETTRMSNGLKEFLWNLDGLGRGTMLDLGPAWQTTLSFFIERGFRVTSDDLLRSWKEFMIGEEERLKKAVDGSDSVDVTPAGRATRFIEEYLRYKEGAFDAGLLGDILDYLEPPGGKQTVAGWTEY